MALTPHPMYKTAKAAAHDPQYHRFQLALMQDDILVLTTFASHHAKKIEIIETFSLEYLSHSPQFEWEFLRSDGVLVGGSDRTEIHPLVSLGARPPLSLVSKPRGICTLFTVDVRHGYSLNYPIVLKDFVPDIYEQLNLG